MQISRDRTDTVTKGIDLLGFIYDPIFSLPSRPSFAASIPSHTA